MKSQTKMSVGISAPKFSLPDQTGKNRNIDEFRGKWLLLYFYPRDFTSGCTVEACSFRDTFTELSRHLAIIGVSSDSVRSHEKFSKKYSLPFLLLADENKEVIKAYRVNGIILPKRTSFLIDPDGMITKIYTHVNPAKHSTEIIHDMNTFRVH